MRHYRSIDRRIGVQVVEGVVRRGRITDARRRWSSAGLRSKRIVSRCRLKSFLIYRFFETMTFLLRFLYIYMKD